MKIALFGGSFDPVHLEHIALVEAAKQTLALDRVIVLPAYLSPFKEAGAFARAEDRLETCKIAFAHLPYVEVSDYEIQARGTSYTYLTCQHFREQFPHDELFFLLGADSLASFPRWKNPEKILENVTLCACGRGEDFAEESARTIEKQFGKKVILLPYCGREVSSTRLRVELAFGKEPEDIAKDVFGYIREKGLYTHPAILPALALEKEPRREHSFRVALLACKLAPQYGIPFERALLASALHDCGKYVPLDSPLLSGFIPPEGVPDPVMHQYTGAYLAEHLFHVTDREVLDAIRFHTSGRENMSNLEKLVYLADMLEEGRAFEGVESLRAALYRDLDECFSLALQRQIEYLHASGSPVYSLTEQAFQWSKRKK